MKKKSIVSGVVAIAVAGTVVWLLLCAGTKRGEAESISRQRGEATPSSLQKDAGLNSSRSGKDSASPAPKDLTADESGVEAEEPKSDEEKREREEEKLVNDFDNLTDKWTESSPKGVSMDDIDKFAKTFRKIPKTRQDECIHRALNLIPDENVMLLAGVLMDKSMDKEIVETVYNDILNRSEEVKKPILQQIFKDKSHPCWTDTAWILDVTGELPKKK